MTIFKNFLYFFRSSGWRVISWITRPDNLIMKAGFFLCLIGFGGASWASFDVEYSSPDGTLTSVQLEKSDSKPFMEQLMVGVGVVGLMMILGESIYIVNCRRKILNVAIEHIALREKITNPLIKYVSKESGGSDTLPIDLTKYYSNFVVESPQKALDLTVVSLSDTFASQVKQAGSKDVTVHYGGTAPVGLGFLAGFLLGNTSDVVTWDFNRDSGQWYKLGGFGDTNKPFADWSNYHSEKEVCILMEISHPVTIEDVRKKMPEMPYVKVSMPEVKYDNMASKEKVDEFQSEFREMLKKLNADGVEKVHIFCAAQASFNFCMGRQITKNHPSCVVYEYQNSVEEKYPWGVLFNTKNDGSPTIV